jgi:hypothetical protein
MKRRQFLLSSLSLALSACGAGPDQPPADRFEGSSLHMLDYVPTVVLSGNWRAMGRQYSHLLADNIRATYRLIASYRHQCNRGCGRMNSDIANEIFDAYAQRFREFFLGMAETSGLSLDQLKATNALEMILIFGADIYPQTRCSRVCARSDHACAGYPVYGRNYDYTRDFIDLNDQVVVTVFHPDDEAMPFAICTWAGCIYASTGINQRGIFVEENDCSPHDREAAGFFITGDHYNMKTWVRDDAMLLSLLASAASMDEVDAWMKRHLPVYPHNIGVADDSEARCYQRNIPERLPQAPYVRQAEGLMALTNHYFQVPQGWGLAPFSEGDGIDRTIPGGSIARLNTARAGCQA